MRTSENFPSEFRVNSINTSKIFSVKKGFTPILIVLFLAAVGVFGIILFKFNYKNTPINQIINSPKDTGQAKTEIKIPRFGKKPINEPNHLFYLKSEVESVVSQDQAKKKYTLMKVDENGENKKQILIFKRDESNPMQKDKPGGQVIGADNFWFTRIKGDSDLYYYNSQGQIDSNFEKFSKDYLELFGIYKDQLYEFTASAHPNVSVDSILYASVLKPPKNENITTIEVVETKTKNVKSFDIQGNYIDNGWILHFSPDNKKLFVCACVGFYFSGSSLGFWEIDLESSKISQMDYINNLHIRNGIFRYAPNTVYGATYSKYSGFKDPHEGDPQERSKSVYKINLDNHETRKVDLKSYFNHITVSKTGKFALADYRDDTVSRKFIINLDNGNEFPLEITDIDDNEKWSDSDKLAVNFSSTQAELYIFDAKTNKKVLVDTINKSNFDNYCCNSGIEIIGWIH